MCIIQRSHNLLREMPEEAAQTVKQAFIDEGIEVTTDTKILGIQSRRGAVSISFEHQNKIVRKRGRSSPKRPWPSAEHFKAEVSGRAGVKTDSAGRIVTNRWQQKSAPNIYAAGDCCGPHEIVHVAIQQGELAARHSAKVRGLRPVYESMMLNVVFSDPQVGTIGRREGSSRELEPKATT